jgi:methyl-accepting chemotaxis protein
VSSQKSIKLSFSTAFQIKYCLVVVAVFVCANFLLYLLMDRTLSGSYLESLRTLYFLDQNLTLYLSIVALLQIFFILILTLIITLLVSHQIAGPIFRYEEVLGRISAGQFPEQIATRSTDQLKPMVDSLNVFTAASRNVYGNAQILVEDIEAHPDADFEGLRQQIFKVRESMGAFYSEGTHQ